MFAATVSRFAPMARTVAFRGNKSFLRTMTTADASEGQFSAAWNTSSSKSLASLRVNLPRLVTEDITAAARFAAAKAAAIGSCSYCLIDDM